MNIKLYQRASLNRINILYCLSPRIIIGILKGRIPGNVKKEAVWPILRDTKRPIDGRTKQGKEKQADYE